MQATFDGLGDIINQNGFRGVVTDSARSTQKNHGGRNLLCEDHRVVSCAANHSVRSAARLSYCFFDLAGQRAVHLHGWLIESLNGKDRKTATLRNVFRFASQVFDCPAAHPVVAVAHVEGQSDFACDYVRCTGFRLNRAHGCDQAMRVLGRAFHGGDPLRCTGHGVEAKIHRSRARMIRAAEECEFQPALTSYGFHRRQRQA